MCEEMLPVKALNFLQTEVSAVVDHSDAEEAEAFRSLLTYLLTPSASSTSARTKEPASEKEHIDSPPRKRSRPNTPDDDRDHDYDYDRDHDRHDHEDTWTDKLGDEDEDEHAHSHSMRAVSAFSLKGIEDPIERVVRRERSRESEDAGKRERGSNGGRLSGTRFSQRNEVFESMLEFVTDNEKQPGGSLLDIIDGDEGGL
jgi:muskelin